MNNRFFRIETENIGIEFAFSVKLSYLSINAVQLQRSCRRSHISGEQKKYWKKNLFEGIHEE
jgi:hypothetical protein